MSRRRVVLVYAAMAEIAIALTGWAAIDTAPSGPIDRALSVALLAILPAVFGAMAAWEAARP